MNVVFVDFNCDFCFDIFIINIWFWVLVWCEVMEMNIFLFLSEENCYECSMDEVFVEYDFSWVWVGFFFDVENDGDDDFFVVNGFMDYMIFVQY